MPTLSHISHAHKPNKLLKRHKSIAISTSSHLLQLYYKTLNLNFHDGNSQPPAITAAAAVAGIQNPKRKHCQIPLQGPSKRQLGHSGPTSRPRTRMVVPRPPESPYHMMLILTGESEHRGYRFRPRSITTVGELVIVEGWEEEIITRAYWVHVWTVKDGTVAEFREYFNTWITVILQVPAEDGKENVKVWQSEPQQRLNWSLPDLVLTV
ncbi:hypothetical protein RHGRI_036162 [Rhododendron griersonianum]|uniref:Wound-induced protein 1 n=1 Tax=Rhododendron griersonianum TaxID=479676 RepID=A0AAV6HLZ9_9ERIC|nr:hypothetical protein RHGRI_036162 [Rhododendron griersonianum]